MQGCKVTVKIVVDDKKALRALRVIGETLADLEEDFAYRDDVKRASRAVSYLAKHLRVVPVGYEQKLAPRK